MNAPSIFSRILLVTGALAVIGLSYWFIATSLAPVPVPPATPSPGSVRFDTSADVTKHPGFSDLQLLGPAKVIPVNLGRENPFIPVPAASTSTTSTPEVATATSEIPEEATTTQMFPVEQEAATATSLTLPTETTATSSP